MSWYCYLIKSDENYTYTGITNNIEKRLRAHNKLIKGGAKATRKGNNWKLLRIKEFPNKSLAAKFEWNMKHVKTKNGKWISSKSGIEARIKRFDQL